MNTLWTIGIVIPSHAEWTTIAQTIAWFTQSVDNISNWLQTSITVVVNEASNADTQISNSNSCTLKFLNALKRLQISDEVSNQKPDFVQWDFKQLFPSAWLTEVEATRQIINILKYNKNISIDIIDLHTNAPKKCNVGIARNEWVKSLMSKYDSLTKIIMADGDTQPWIGHIRKVIKYMNYDFFHGPRVSLCPVSFENTLKIINRNFYILDIFRCFREAVVLENASVYYENDFILRWTNINNATTSNVISISESTEWAHMVFSPSVFNKIGWFEDMTGSEDINFWTTARKLGYNPVMLNDFPIATIERLSNRTTSWQWISNQMYCQNFSNIKVIPMSILKSLPSYFNYLIQNYWKTMSQNIFQKKTEAYISELKLMSKAEWEYLYSLICKKCIVTFNENTATEVVSFLEKRVNNIPVRNAMRIFDTQSKSQLAKLGIDKAWEWFTQELKSVWIIY